MQLTITLKTKNPKKIKIMATWKPSKQQAKEFAQKMQDPDFAKEYYEKKSKKEVSMKVILSIKPEFVEKIINGEKKFEYRRKIFKKDVEKVLIYASSPIKLIVGEFIVEDILSLKIDELWKLTKEESGISRQYFYEYFMGLESGYAIKIKEFKKYENPLNLRDLNIFYVPQSFVYI